MKVIYPEYMCLTYDDVNIIPKYSEVQSRENVSLRTKFTRNIDLGIPIVAAPMDTVCGENMAITLAKAGGIGCIHRFMSIEEQVQAVQSVSKYGKTCAAVGVTGDFLERSSVLLDAGCDVLLIDVAHGHHVNVKNAISTIKNFRRKYPFNIIAGSIATPEAAQALYEWGADAVRVGVGNGSLCETRIRTAYW